MKKLLKNRILPIILVLSMCLSMMVVPARAAGVTLATVAGYIGTAMDVTDWLNCIDQKLNGASVDTGFWLAPKNYLDYENNRLEVTEDDLNAFVRDFRSNWITGTNFYVEVSTVSANSGNWRIVAFKQKGVNSNSFYNYCLAYEGKILCAPVDDEEGSTNYGYWVPYTDRLHEQETIISEDVLALFMADQIGAGVNCVITQSKSGKILSNPGEYAWSEEMVFVDPSGKLYVSPGDNRAPQVENNYYTGTTEITTENVEIVGGGETDVDIGINIDAGTLVLPDGTELEIDQTIYDDSTKTYYVDARDENNTYYNYTIQYHVDYTSITYIGQTAEYNKYYEIYYELPDGRSSADLTKEELEQLNVSLDVIPYDRAADDTSLRGLYHFDGDTRDASYWNYVTSFDWTLGASIVYMDAGTFGGALYMDESNHSFNITLPSPLSTSDFTIQWRYYQSYTGSAASAPDGYVSSGSNFLFSWDGKQFYTGLGSTALASTPTGQWTEIALVRHSGTLYYYLNGLCIGSTAYTTSLVDKLTFGFGALQQTYKYFDELRILDKAIVPDGASYTPTSVPHDTNLTLVLPDPDSIPVADEYWVFNDEGNLLDHYDFTNGWDAETWAYYADFSAVNFETAYAADSNLLRNGWVYGTSSGSGSIRSDIAAFNTYAQFIGNAGTDTSGDPMIYYPIFKTDTTADTTSGYYVELVDDLSLKSDAKITGTILLSDGTQYSVTHTVLSVGRLTNNDYKNLDGTFTESVQLPNGAVLGFYVVDAEDVGTAMKYQQSAVMLAVTIPEGETLDVVYAELVAGDTANTGHEFVSNIVGIEGDKINRPTLAVRTDLTITGHQIGGSRPSVPKKGLVWALVEGGVIKSLQIYNGSAWEAVDGRIWTGERWIPYSAYNIILLKDMYDITGIVTPDDYEYIYTESGFWDWWQRSWNDFVAWIKGNGGTGNTVIVPGDDVLPPSADDDGGTWNFIDLLVVIKDGLWAIGKGITVTVFDGVSGLASAVSSVGSFFGAFSSGSEVFGIYDAGGVDVWG